MQQKPFTIFCTALRRLLSGIAAASALACRLLHALDHVGILLSGTICSHARPLKLQFCTSFNPCHYDPTNSQLMCLVGYWTEADGVDL